MNISDLFKRLNVKSDWPFQPYVLKHAAQLRAAEYQAKGKASSEEISAAIRKGAKKEAERFFRAGARFAHEFGLEPVSLLKTAQEQIEREIPGAKAKFAAAKVEALEEHVVAAETLKAQMLSFGKASGEN